MCLSGPRQRARMQNDWLVSWVASSWFGWDGGGGGGGSVKGGVMVGDDEEEQEDLGASIL